jgi:hypothetical protein
MTMSIDRRLPVLFMAAIFFMPIAQANKGAEFPAAPAAQGKGSRLLVNPFGEVDGLLLDTGTLVTFPPHMGEQLAAAVKPGDTVEVKGYPEAPGQIKGYVITPSNSNQSLMVQAKPPKGIIKMPKHVRSAGLEAMNAQGEIRHLHFGKHGEINGVSGGWNNRAFFTRSVLPIRALVENRAGHLRIRVRDEKSVWPGIRGYCARSHGADASTGIPALSWQRVDLGEYPPPGKNRRYSARQLVHRRRVSYIASTAGSILTDLCRTPS